MGRKSTLTALAALSSCAALSAPVRAEGLVAENVQATFSTSRKGLPRHSVKLRGTVTERDELARFRPEDSGLQLRIGAFTGFLSPAKMHGGEVLNISDSGSQLQVSWRSRILCTPFVCPSGGLGGSDCPDFSAWQFVRVRRVLSNAVEYQAPPSYVVDCP